jgi:hypothetical protein
MTASLAFRRLPVDGPPAAGEPASVATSSAPRAAIRHIALLVSPADLRVFHRELAVRLERDAAVRVTLLRARAERFLPAKVDLLLDLERLLYRSHHRSQRHVDRARRASHLPQI